VEAAAVAAVAAAAPSAAAAAAGGIIIVVALDSGTRVRGGCCAASTGVRSELLADADAEVTDRAPSPSPSPSASASSSPRLSLSSALLAVSARRTTPPAWLSLSLSLIGLDEAKKSADRIGAADGSEWQEGLRVAPINRQWSSEFRFSHSSRRSETCGTDAQLNEKKKKAKKKQLVAKGVRQKSSPSISRRKIGHEKPRLEVARKHVSLLELLSWWTEHQN